MQLHQLDLQPFERVLVVLLLHLLVIGIAARTQRILLDPVRQFRVVDVERALDAGDLDLERACRFRRRILLGAFHARRNLSSFVGHAIGSVRGGPARKFRLGRGRRSQEDPMADTRREEQARRFVSLASGRLAQNRWTLAAGMLAILAMHFYAGGSALFTAAAILLFVVVDGVRAEAHARPAPGRSGGGRRRRRPRRPVRPEPRRRGQRSADHLRRGGQRRSRQRSGPHGLRRARTRHVAAVEIPRARDAGGDRARAFGRRAFRGRRLRRARSHRTRLQGHRLGHRAGHRAFRRRLQGPERGAAHRPHARRLHRQRQPRIAHPARLDLRLRRDAARPGPERRRGARSFPRHHAEPDRAHGAADRRPPVAVAARDEALSAAGRDGGCPLDRPERDRFA